MEPKLDPNRTQIEDGKEDAKVPQLCNSRDHHHRSCAFCFGRKLLVASPCHISYLYGSLVDAAGEIENVNGSGLARTRAHRRKVGSDDRN